MTIQKKSYPSNWWRNSENVSFEKTLTSLKQKMGIILFQGSTQHLKWSHSDWLVSSAGIYFPFTLKFGKQGYELNSTSLI